MGLTFANIANVGAQTALATGQAQASSLGLGQTEAKALAVTSLVQRDEDKTINTLMGGAKSGGRLRGNGLKKDLMAIGQAALVKGPGRGAGGGNSGLGGGGSILNTTV
ncbi:MAG: hypothetical protein V1797_16945 [Pseudomonadota bacterium]